MEPVRRCPNCRAPNPKGRSTCWSCQSALAARAPAPAPDPASALSVPDANPWGMEAYRRTCTGCGQVHGIFNRACPRCGTPSEAAIPVHSDVFASRWERTPTANGGTRLRLNRRYLLAVRWGTRGIEELEAVGGNLAELTGWSFQLDHSVEAVKSPWFRIWP